MENPKKMDMSVHHTYLISVFAFYAGHIKFFSMDADKFRSLGYLSMIFIIWWNQVWTEQNNFGYICFSESRGSWKDQVYFPCRECLIFFNNTYSKDFDVLFGINRRLYGKKLSNLLQHQWPSKTNLNIITQNPLQNLPIPSCPVYKTAVR